MQEQLDDRLLIAASEEGDSPAKKRRRDATPSPHWGAASDAPIEQKRIGHTSAVFSFREATFCSIGASEADSVFGTTVNHVVLAACTRTLRNYLEAHGGVPDSPLVAAIPVSLRRPDELGSYGNRISAFFVRLPIHLTDPIDQLLAVRHEAESSKQLHADLGFSALGQWAEFTSGTLLRRAARLYSERKLAGRHRPLHNLGTSNVRGPETPLYAAGARLTGAYPLGPLMEGVGMNITVVSYLESLDFGVIACERSVPHASDIALGFGAAVADLHKIALENTPGTPSPLSVASN